jgi:ketosteroid isomerase-like protein
MRDSKLGPEHKAAFLRAMQRFSLEQSAEEAVNVNPESENAGRHACPACGTANRKENNFCASCGATLVKSARQSEAASPSRTPVAEAPGDHHYHHHYHHHYFSSGDSIDLGQIADMRAAGSVGAREIGRVRAPLGGPSVSRAEAALRKTTQDWALACNTKQLDDLVDLYVPDALVQRPNVPAVRGAAAIREFFFGLLEAGMSEVELDPIRTELLGDFGYEAGRCKSLVPIAMGKRREERGKYLVLLSRQANGEWRIVADSWSSDLSLGVASEQMAKPGASLEASPPRLPRKP